MYSFFMADFLERCFEEFRGASLKRFDYSSLRVRPDSRTTNRPVLLSRAESKLVSSLLLRLPTRHFSATSLSFELAAMAVFAE